MTNELSVRIEQHVGKLANTDMHLSLYEWSVMADDFLKAAVMLRSGRLVADNGWRDDVPINTTKDGWTIDPVWLREFTHSLDWHADMETVEEIILNLFRPAIPPDPSSEKQSPSDRLGFWMSAALEDPSVCAEMKADIEAWFDASMPHPGTGRVAELEAEAARAQSAHVRTISASSPARWGPAHSSSKARATKIASVHARMEQGVLCHAMPPRKRSRSISTRQR